MVDLIDYHVAGKSAEPGQNRKYRFCWSWAQSMCWGRCILTCICWTTSSTTLRFGWHFCTSPQFRMDLQTACELAVAKSKIGDRLMQEIDRVAA